MFKFCKQLDIGLGGDKMTESERKMYNANVKLQDENRNLKFMVIEYKKILEQIKTYIEINKEESGKIKANSILEIIGENYE